MPLAAAQVVDLVVARLAPTAVGGAHPSRNHPVAQASLPMWKVYAGNEPIEQQSPDGLCQHDLQVECEGLVSAVENLDDAMNNLASAAMVALFTTAPDINVALFPLGFARAPASEAGADVAKLTLRVRAVFYTFAHQPDTLVT